MRVDLKSGTKFIVFFGIVFSVMVVYRYVFSYAGKDDANYLSSPLLAMMPITIHTNPGRLGNQMFTFATLYGLSSLNGRNMVVMQSNHDVLIKYFNVHYPLLVYSSSYPEHNPWRIGNWLTEADKQIPRDSNIIKGNIYPTSFTFFEHCRRQIREVFTFKAEFRAYAQGVLAQVKRVRPWTRVYVGVHVRRGDYLKHGWLRDNNGREVDDEYFSLAVKHFTDKYENVTFLAISEDRDWCRRNLSHHGILTTPDSPSAGHDLALLAECNHTIMTYGTYGFWGGYLCGGEVVYFDDFLKPNQNFTRHYFVYDKMYPADWVGISTTKPGFWESYTNPFDP